MEYDVVKIGDAFNQMKISQYLSLLLAMMSLVCGMVEYEIRFKYKTSPNYSDYYASRIMFLSLSQFFTLLLLISIVMSY